jgi:hypothetical protein
MYRSANFNHVHHLTPYTLVLALKNQEEALSYGPCYRHRPAARKHMINYFPLDTEAVTLSWL